MFLRGDSWVCLCMYMIERFELLKIAPEYLASRVRQARQKAGTTVAELARLAGVKPETVERVEDERGDPGVISSLLVAESANVFDFEGKGPESVTQDFVKLLCSKEEDAAVLFNKTAEAYLTPTTKYSVPRNLFSLYNSPRQRGRFVLNDVYALVSIAGRLDWQLVSPIPRDLGNLSKERLKAKCNKDAICSIPSVDQNFWNHLAAGRAVNVSSGRLAKCARQISKLSDGEFGGNEYLEVAASAFVNQLWFERQVKTLDLSKSGMFDFWSLLYDFIRMRRVLLMEESRY